MTNDGRTLLFARIIALEHTLTGNLMKDLETKDEIHKLKMQLNGVEPSCNLGEECENCSG